MTFRDKIQWNFNQNSYIFIQEKAYEYVVYEISAILCRPQCVESWHQAISSHSTDINRACHPVVIAGAACYPGTCTLSCSLWVSATNLKIWPPQMKSTGTQSLNALQRHDYITGYQESSSHNGCQATSPIIHHIMQCNCRCPGDTWK